MGRPQTHPIQGGGGGGGELDLFFTAGYLHVSNVIVECMTNIGFSI